MTRFICTPIVISKKESTAPVSRVLYLPLQRGACHLSTLPVTCQLKHSTLHRNPLRGFGRTALNRWFTRTCSLQMEQPDGRPPTGGLLHRLLTLTPSAVSRPLTEARAGGGRSLLPYPIVADSWHFHQWSVLRCPDFPLVLYPLRSEVVSTSGRPWHCFQCAKVQKIS